MGFNNLTHSDLLRFCEAVDTVMRAEYLSPRERRDLISYWAYRCQEPSMPESLSAAIKRCQDWPNGAVLTATSRIDCVTGEVVAFNPGE